MDMSDLIKNWPAGSLRFTVAQYVWKIKNNRSTILKALAAESLSIAVVAFVVFRNEIFFYSHSARFFIAVFIACVAVIIVTGVCALLFAELLSGEVKHWISRAAIFVGMIVLVIEAAVVFLPIVRFGSRF